MLYRYIIVRKIERILSGAIVYLSGHAYVSFLYRREPMAKLQLSDKDKSDLQASYEIFWKKFNSLFGKVEGISRKVYVYGL